MAQKPPVPVWDSTVPLNEASYVRVTRMPFSTPRASSSAAFFAICFSSAVFGAFEASKAASWSTACMSLICTLREQFANLTLQQPPPTNSSATPKAFSETNRTLAPAWTALRAVQELRASVALKDGGCSEGANSAPSAKTFKSVERTLHAPSENVTLHHPPAAWWATVPIRFGLEIRWTLAPGLTPLSLIFSARFANVFAVPVIGAWEDSKFGESAGTTFKSLTWTFAHLSLN
mmetsp:Transcript_16883/g.57110  ORF Transcript_16883/g.57110 Transcript_16883/m.57110 type:complete len:233 (+) Transcript_16883:730-1428(+)